jgi:predicted membrane protein (TIGR00267 family)
MTEVRGARMDRLLEKALMENWRREMQARALYEAAARRETNPEKRRILEQLARLEGEHARLWADRLSAMGVDTSRLEMPGVNLEGLSGRDLMQRIEAIEQGNAAWYESLRHVVAEDPELVEILDRIARDEEGHQDVGALWEHESSPAKRLNRMWRDERWHKQETGGWVGDAIYGVNDGLGAIFGIIAGVAGYTADSRTILISGVFGALASTLSMGAGAWLATKSENELMEGELAAERREIDADPAHEVEELALLYQLKGFSAEESTRIAAQIASDREQFLKTMAQEELGIHEVSRGNPWRSAFFGGASTLVGGLIPLVPFFFMSGWPAMITAAIVSILAHFVVGALKSVMTLRSWWASGLEMMFVGILVGVVSYVLGLFGAKLL